jgi:putative ATPase
MRPRSLDEFVGQDAIVGPGRLLRRAIQADQLSSLIFYGPPGSGKTTLARVIANSTKGRFITLNAVLSGVADIRKAIEEAKDEKQFYGRRSILFVDEVHRWNKAQQDALLPWVENGTVILIGATTENPFFEVNKALVSRSRVFRLEALSRDDLMETARRALADRERGYGKWKVSFAPGALEHLVDSAVGDARSLSTPWNWPWRPPPEPGRRPRDHPSRSAWRRPRNRSSARWSCTTRTGTTTTTSFPPSSRASAARIPTPPFTGSPGWSRRRRVALLHLPQAPHQRERGRRPGRPAAITVVESCAAAFDRIGFPEGNFHLAQAALYLANCPKSNSTLGFFDALNSVKEENREVPDHLKDGSRDAEELGHGKDYLYPHAYRDHWVAQAYLPLSLASRQFYQPSQQGWEGTAASRLQERRELQLAAYLEAAARNPGAGRESGQVAWLRRLSERGGQAAIADRDRTFSLLAPKRHERILVLNAGEGLFLWEALRRSPEGFVLGLCWKEEEAAVLRDYAARIEGPQAPRIASAALESLKDEVLRAHRR